MKLHQSQSCVVIKFNEMVKATELKCYVVDLPKLTVYEILRKTLFHYIVIFHTLLDFTDH